MSNGEIREVAPRVGRFVLPSVQEIEAWVIARSSPAPGPQEAFEKAMLVKDALERWGGRTLDELPGG